MDDSLHIDLAVDIVKALYNRELESAPYLTSYYRRAVTNHALPSLQRMTGRYFASSSESCTYRRPSMTTKFAASRSLCRIFAVYVLRIQERGCIDA